MEHPGLCYIYVGFSKCRTKSIQKSFEKLGYKVHGSNDHLFNYKSWNKFLDQNLSRVERLSALKHLYVSQKVDVVVGGPVYFFWAELLEIFPEAKVVFFQRDEDSWQKSHEITLNKVVGLKIVPDVISLALLRIFAPESYQMEKFWHRNFNITSGQEFTGWWSVIHGKYVPGSLLNRLNYRQTNASVVRNCPGTKLLRLTESTVSGVMGLCLLSERKYRHRQKHGKKRT